MNHKPYTVFYVVVCRSEDRIKGIKGDTISPNHLTTYIAPGSPLSQKTKIPYLFDTFSHAFGCAEEHEAALKSTLKSNVAPERCVVIPVRIVESTWNDNYSEDGWASINDARRIASGLLHVDFISRQIKNLAGKVLTILDAAYINENQNKAVKDLVKASFKIQLNGIWDEAYRNGDAECSKSEEPEKDILS